MPSATRRFRKSEHVVERKVRGEHILVPFGSGARLDSVFVLDETAAFIWDRAVSSDTEAQITAALVEEFDVAEAAAAADVRALLGQLVGMGALDEIPEPG